MCTLQIRCRWFAVATLAITTLVVPFAAYSQTDSNAATVNLSAALAESITVQVAPGTVNFTLAATGTADGDATIDVDTTWVLDVLSVGTLDLYAYFASSTAALTDGAGSDIPSANVSGSVDSAAHVAFTGNSPFATGSSLQVFTQTIILVNASGSSNNTLDLRIDTTGLVLPAGTYAGTLTFQARAS